MTVSARLLPMASTGCSCCAPSDVSDPGTAAPVAVARETDTPANLSAVYGVEGMTCGHCAGNVTAALTALEGVKDVELDLVPGGTSTVTVTGTTAPTAVREAIEEAGYTVASS